MSGEHAREGARAPWSGAGVACSIAAAERDWLHVVCSVLIGAELEDRITAHNYRVKSSHDMSLLAPWGLGQGVSGCGVGLPYCLVACGCAMGCALTARLCTCGRACACVWLCAVGIPMYG